MKNDPRMTFGYLLNRTNRLLSRRAEKRLAPLGLAVAQIPVLGALREGASLTQKELAAMAQIEQPAMAELLSRMERDGYIRRSPDPRDRRSSLISLTASAKKKLAPAREAFVAGHDEALSGFSEAEIAQFMAFLQRTVSNLESLDDAK
jgi:MarR family transcriptional regulator for hemolysin